VPLGTDSVRPHRHLKGTKQATSHVRIALKGYIATTSQVARSPPYRANPGARRAVPDLPCATGTIAGVDRKRISVMYTPLTMLMMPRGFDDAIIMRSQQAFVFREPNRAARENALSVLSTEMIVSTTPGTVEQGEQ